MLLQKTELLQAQMQGSENDDFRVLRLKITSIGVHNENVITLQSEGFYL